MGDNKKVNAMKSTGYGYYLLVIISFYYVIISSRQVLTKANKKGTTSLEVALY